MNQNLKLISLTRQLLKPRYSVPNVVPARSIQRELRPTLLSINARKKEEASKYPRPIQPRYTYLEWNYNAEIFAFGKRLGEDFNDDILRQAFTDKSYAIDQMKKQEELGLEKLEMKHNEFLCTEGRTLLHKTLDSVLKEHFPKFPILGIEAVVNHLMSESMLSNISSLIGTKDLILCNEYPPTEPILARTFLAIIATVEKSSGTQAAETFIKHFILTYLCDKEINDFWDIPKPWLMLTDIMNQKGETFEPRLLRESGRNSLLSVFVVGLYDSKKELIGTGIGETIDIAQEMAARDTLKGIFDTRHSVYDFKLR